MKAADVMHVFAVSLANLTFGFEFATSRVADSPPLLLLLGALI
jgi:hypothetical protein